MGSLLWSEEIRLYEDQESPHGFGDCLTLRIRQINVNPDRELNGFRDTTIQG
jgi:hypothetical protein